MITLQVDVQSKELSQHFARRSWIDQM